MQSEQDRLRKLKSESKKLPTLHQGVYTRAADYLYLLCLIQQYVCPDVKSDIVAHRIIATQEQLAFADGQLSQAIADLEANYKAKLTVPPAVKNVLSIYFYGTADEPADT
jgi:hypothetical protein